MIIHDASAGIDRNLYVDKIAISTFTAASGTTTIPRTTTSVPVDTTPPSATITD